MSQILLTPVSWVFLHDIALFPLNILFIFILTNSLWSVTCQSTPYQFYLHSNGGNYFFHFPNYYILQIITDVPKNFSSTWTTWLYLQSTEILIFFSIMVPLNHNPFFFAPLVSWFQIIMFGLLFCSLVILILAPTTWTPAPRFLMSAVMPVTELFSQLFGSSLLCFNGSFACWGCQWRIYSISFRLLLQPSITFLYPPTPQKSLCAIGYIVYVLCVYVVVN